MQRDQMSSLLKGERHKRIRRLIEDNGRATVAELSVLFGVSEATIRRDLEEMDERGWIRREHGGALCADRATAEPPILQRVAEQESEKRRIGRAAAQLVQDGETIFIGSGTTTLEVARNLGAVENLTVITNALNIVTELVNCSGITLIVIGGLLRPSELSLVGHLTEQALKELRADKVFLGMRAVNIQDGLTNDYLPETMTDRAIIGIASEVILAADHTKFGRVSTSRVAPVTAVDIIVTDDEVPDTIIHQFEELGIRVIIA
jgi:DeoR/GlpR family transcriptional regulator of sugar metabolism